MLGPLLNPANPNVMVLGVSREELGELYINTLRDMGLVAALVVHGMEGLDEISPCGESKVWHLKDGKVQVYMVEPQTFGVERCELDQVAGGTSKENADLFRGIAEGRVYVYYTCFLGVLMF